MKTKNEKQSNGTNMMLTAGVHNIDFGLKDDKGNVLLVGHKVSLKSKEGDWQKTVELEYEKGVFGFRDDDAKNLIPIAWHVGHSSVIKI